MKKKTKKSITERMATAATAKAVADNWTVWWHSIVSIFLILILFILLPRCPPLQTKVYIAPSAKNNYCLAFGLTESETCHTDHSMSLDMFGATQCLLKLHSFHTHTYHCFQTPVRYRVANFNQMTSHVVESAGYTSAVYCMVNTQYRIVF